MFNTLINAWKVEDIRKKLLFVILILAIYQLGTYIPLPGIDILQWQAQMGSQDDGNALLSLYMTIAGGNFGTIFAMGIAPYINSSIIMQLLTVAIPYLENLKKEGEEGRKKINQITRFVAVGLAALQAIGTVYSIHPLFTYQTIPVYVMATVSLITGTIFIMWLGELLTEKAIGNGASFIIFANILSNLPSGIKTLWDSVKDAPWTQYVLALLMLVLFVALITFVVFIQDGERRVPVQYSKKMVGRQMYGGQTSYIPIKANIAGVMSIIFAISLLQFPSVINQFVNPQAAQGIVSAPWLMNVVNVLSISHPVGAVLYVLLIFAFTFFYTSFAINPVEMAENMKKSGGFLPGIRPGKPTSDLPPWV